MKRDALPKAAFASFLIAAAFSFCSSDTFIASSSVSLPSLIDSSERSVSAFEPAEELGREEYKDVVVEMGDDAAEYVSEGISEESTDLKHRMDCRVYDGLPV